MKQEVFQHMLDTIRAQEAKIDKLYELEIDLINFTDSYNSTINMLLSVYFGKEGVEWIDWYLYERAGRADITAYDCDGNLICYDDQSLWEEVERCRLENEEEYELKVPMTEEERLKHIAGLFGGSYDQ